MGLCCSKNHNNDNDNDDSYHEPAAKVSRMDRSTTRHNSATKPSTQNQNRSKHLRDEKAPSEAPDRKRPKPYHDAFQFSALPLEIKQKVASFLPAGDCVHLMQTCKSVSSELELKTTSSPLFLEGRFALDLRGASTTGDQFQCFAAIVPQQPERLHSMTFDCVWTDQRWGNRKGQLIIAAQNKPASANSESESLRSLSLQEGTVVSRSPIAEHRNTRLTLSFYPQLNKVYQIWGKAGGGGGHTLHLRDINLHRLGFGNDSTDYDSFRFEVEGSYDPTGYDTFEYEEGSEVSVDDDSWVS